MADTRLRITGIAPALAVPGGEVTIHCEGFVPGLPCDSKVLFGTIEASISSASEDRIVVRVPDSPQALGVALRVGDAVSPLFPFQSARQVAKGLHPVTSPAVASDGSVGVVWTADKLSILSEAALADRKVDALNAWWKGDSGPE